jgi:Ca-activated chloride channel family protein
MGLAFSFPAALFLLLGIPALVWLAWPRLRPFPPLRRWMALGCRLAGGSLLVIALAQPAVRSPDDGVSVVFVVDLSASLAPETQAQALDWVRRAEAAQGPHDRSAVVVIGQRAVTVRPFDAPDQALSLAEASGAAGLPPADGTNLQEGLRLARALLPATGSRRVVLLSDGWETSGHAADEILPLVAAGVQVSVVPLAAAAAGSLLVQAIEVPTYVREGEPFEASVAVYSMRETEATVRVRVDEAVAGERRVALPAGLTRVAVQTALRGQGLHRLTAEVVAEEGRAESIQPVVVKAPARILVLEDRADEAQSLAAALEAAGLQVEVRHPTRGSRPLDLAQLRAYDGVVLYNVAASTLTLDQLRALDTFVQTMGRGLTVVGGTTSYALGGYAGSPLERVLPLSADAPFQQERGTLALVLVIDRSGSMSLRADNVSKMAMAREAALLVTETLRPDDQLGVLAFDIRNDWVVPLDTLAANGGLGAVQQAIRGIEADGGTDIYPALERAYNAIVKSNARFKHIILLSDGQSWGGAYDQLLERMRASGVTLSTVGIGQDIDADLMSRLARGGLGRYYFTERAAEIPRIMLRETNIVTRPVVMEGRVQPRVGAASPLLRDMAPAELPALNGYVVTLPKADAEVALWSERGDPLLASWQYGLGRVVAWTADAGTGWSGAWLAWPRFGQFWSQVVRWTLAPAEQSDLRVLLRPEGQAPQGGVEVLVRAEALREDGSFLDRAPTEARIRAPDGGAGGRGEARLPLVQVAPGRYEGRFLATSPGLYRVEVVQEGPGAAPRRELAGLVVPADPERAHVGTNESLLTRLAGETGGHVLRDPADAFTHELPARGERWDPLAPLLASLALLLFPLDVAVRRLRWPGG